MKLYGTISNVTYSVYYMISMYVDGEFFNDELCLVI